MAETPAPLTPMECDCTDLDGFMLNTERLMASELVALSSHEVVAAALFLWCRAWKQRPAASLPDDDRVNAAFSKLPLAKFRKMKDEILRGFIKCSDGRLYHRVLSEEATRAYAKKMQFQKKREADAERLRKWRENQQATLDETHNETHKETHDETRFVAEGQGRDRDQEERKKDAAPPAREDLTPQEILWRDGPAALGALAKQPPEKFKSFIGGLIRDHGPQRVLDAIAKAQAEKAIEPKAFISAWLKPKSTPDHGGIIPRDF